MNTCLRIAWPTSFEGTGREHEAAVLENDLAQAAIGRGELPKAVRHIEKALSHLTDFQGQTEAETLFLSAVLDLSNLRLRLGQNMDEVPALLARAREVAIALGDRRSRALVDLHMARFAYFSDNLDNALAAFVSGLDEVEELGDEDILCQSAEFIGNYYFLHGMYKEAIRHYERALGSEDASNNGLTGFMASCTFGYCAAYLGRFNQAVGVLDYNWRLYSRRSEPTLAALFRAVLGVTLMIMGKRDQARFHLQEAYEAGRAINNSRSVLVAQAGLSYCHLIEGRTEESARLLLQSLKEAAEGDFPVRQYSFPWLLDIFYELQHFDSELKNPQFPYEQEMSRLIAGPNIHLRGVAYRILAQDAIRNSEDYGQVRSKLEISERYLMRSGDPVELAKTRAVMGRLEMLTGNKANAADLARRAWAELSRYGGAFFPEELKPFIEDEPSGRTGRDNHIEVVERLLDMMDEFIPSTNLDELLARVSAVSTKFLGAERCGLFWFSDPDSDQAPELRATFNLPPQEVEAETFHSSLAMIIQSYRRNQPLVSTVRTGGEESFGLTDRTALCLPFEIRGKVSGVLYHDCSYVDKCFDFIEPGILQKISRQMSAYIERIWEYSRLMEKKMHIDSVRLAPLESTNEKEIVTQSRVMLDLLDQAGQVADSEASVLILGETGVGKELLAQRLHAMSPRSRGPFVVVDLTTIPENLVESELFGHEKGAFTGADRQKKGRIELADQGTLFLDEVGETPLFIQNKLLRVIQEKSFVRIGGTRPLTSDFRLLAATNRNLSLEVSKGRFREDLYYRLNVVPITMPPLRERGRDIVLLARHFLDYYSRKHVRPDLRLSPEDEAALTGYHWPGNVRELQNVMERAVLLAEGDGPVLNLPHEPAEPATDPFFDTPTADELLKRYIRFVLNKTGGKLSGPGGAAEILGMKRTTLFSRMKKLGLS